MLVIDLPYKQINSLLTKNNPNLFLPCFCTQINDFTFLFQDSGYHPQVEAISPTGPMDVREDSEDVSVRRE